MSEATTGDERPDAVLRALLAEHPDARVSAVTDGGTPCAVPDDVVLGPDHLPGGTTGLLAYRPEDRPTVMTVFEQMQSTGHGRGRVTLTASPDTPLDLHMLDVLDTVGVVMVVGVPTGAAGVPRQRGWENERLSIPARLARAYKSGSGGILAVDEGFTEILGWEPAEVTGHRSLEFLHPDDHDLALQSWAVLVGGETGQSPRARLRHRSRDGRWVWFDVMHHGTVRDGEACYVADMVDVSEEIEAQQALAAREQLMAELARALPVGIAQIGPDDDLAYANPRLLDLLDVDVADTVGDLLTGVTTGSREAFTGALTRLRTGRGESDLDVRLTNRGGERICHATLRRLAARGSTRHRVILCVSDITEQTALRRDMERQASLDPLTGCLNRTATMRRLAALLGPDEEPAAVLFLDLDDFKPVNDRFGHATGDRVLVAVAGRIRGALRDDAVVGRLGGDEFVVVIPGLPVEAARAAADRLAETLRRDITIDVLSLPSSASIGVALARPDETPDDLVRRADEAMYAAKRLGGGRVVVAAGAAADAPAAVSGDVA